MKKAVKKISLVICFLFLVVILPNITAKAENIGGREVAISGKCGDNAYWNFDKNTGTITISGTGAMYNYSLDEGNYILAPWRDIFYNFSGSNYGNMETKLVRKIVIEKGITRIGDWSFWSVATIREVDIAKTVTKIGEGSFGGCCYDNDNQEESTDLKLTLRKGLKTISKQAFADCSFKNITIPDSVTTIGDSAFGAVRNVTIGKNVTKIGNYNFSPFMDNKTMKVNIKSKKLKYVGTNVFFERDRYIKKIQINVPSNKYDSYKTLITKALDKQKKVINKERTNKGILADWQYRKPTFKKI